MSRDANHTYLHLHTSSHADLLEDFTNPSTSRLQPDEIYQLPEFQPLNPEDEDDVVPDMHAAFGIQRATQGKKEPGWRDLGLVDLMKGIGLNGGNAGVGASGGANFGAGGAGSSLGNSTAGAERGDGSAQARAGDVLRARRRAEGSVGGRLRG